MCPLCNVFFWQTSVCGHINNFRITRNQWLEVSFLDHHNHLVCVTCKFVYDKKSRQSGCHRPLGMSKQCCGWLCCPSEILATPNSVQHLQQSLPKLDTLAVHTSHTSVTLDDTAHNAPAVNPGHCSPVSTSLPYSDHWLRVIRKLLIWPHTDVCQGFCSFMVLQ